MKTYSVSCRCGQSQTIAAGDAGRTVPCPCGQLIEIAMLSQLRREAGEAVLAPELEIATKLQDQLLPEETDCLVCQRTTNDVAWIPVECETVTMKDHPRSGSCLMALFVNVLSLPGLLLWSLVQKDQDSDEREFGRDVRFTLPLRFCRSCAESPACPPIKELLERVPVYRRLLKKYEGTRIG